MATIKIKDFCSGKCSGKKLFFSCDIIFEKQNFFLFTNYIIMGVKIFMKVLESYAGYSTEYGKCVCGDSLELMKQLDDESVDLVMTSPPFALQRKKEYGNMNQDEYIKWFCDFGKIIFKKLKSSGSFVIDIGGAYEKGSPSYSLYQFRVLISLCDEIGFILAQPFYWHNPSALPAPIEWVNKKKFGQKLP